MFGWLRLDPHTHIYIYLESVSQWERHEHVYVATPLSVLKKHNKNDIFCQKKKERMELGPQTHIYLDSVSPGERHKHIYMVTPLSVFKNNKNGTFARKKNGATGLKLWHADTSLPCK